MADYYPLVKKAIEALDPNAPGESRRSLYERAREALRTQLRSVQPPLTESEITRERLSLEEAVRKVESEAAERARDRARPDPGAWRRPVRERSDPLAEFDQLIESTNPFRSHRDIKPNNVLPLPLPPVTVIPEQNERRAIAFRPSRRGPLELLPDPPRDPHDPEQSQLYLRIRQQLTKLKEDVPTQQRAQIDDVINDFLEQPVTWQQVEFKKVLWLCGNALRNVIAQHDAVKNSSEPHYSKLPPTVAEALRRPVEAWNVFILGDPDLVELDAKRLGPQDRAAVLIDLKAGRPIMENAAADREITTEQTGKIIAASLQAASAPDNIHVKQAQDLAAGTSQNLAVQLVRNAYLTCQSLANPRTDEDRALVAAYKHGIARGAGAATVAGVLFAGKLAGPPFIEFVVHNATALRDYLTLTFQNPQLMQVIDAIEQARAALVADNEP